MKPSLRLIQTVRNEPRERDRDREAKLLEKTGPESILCLKDTDSQLKC